MKSFKYNCFFLLLARFKECPVIAVAAKPGGPEAPDTEEPHGVPELIEVKAGYPLIRLYCCQFSSKAHAVSQLC